MYDKHHEICNYVYDSYYNQINKYQIMLKNNKIIINKHI